MNDESQVPLGDESTDGLDSGVREAGVSSSFTPGKPASAASKILVVLFGTALIIGGIYMASPREKSSMLALERPGFDQEANRLMATGYMTPFLMPGVDHPEIRDLADVRFAGACLVIGVTVGDSHRAYPLTTLLGSQTVEGEMSGIVNDRVGGKLITVTNDADSELTRVVCLPEGSTRKTIELGLMGRGEGGGMMLTADNETYFKQDAEEFPGLSNYPFETTTLKKWQEKHSGTDVYVGDLVTPDLQMEATLQLMTAPERVEADRVLKERNRKRKILSPGRKTGPASEPAAQPKVQPKVQPGNQPDGD
jgi:hypothetical protein